MTIEELVPMIMAKADEYAVDSVEEIPVGTRQVRKNKKKRINKKWLKRYGVATIYETKKCKKIDVSIPLIIEFCKNEGLPMPDEFQQMCAREV